MEQKNWTHVRQWFGYHRLENQKTVPLTNNLYTHEWKLFHNFFCPAVKLIEKKRIASKTIKRYDKPKTPYQRVIESKDVPPAQKQALKEQFAGLNPDFGEFVRNRKPIIRAVRQGATAVFVELAEGKYEVAGDKVTIVPCAMGARHFISCGTGHPLIADFPLPVFVGLYRSQHKLYTGKTGWLSILSKELFQG